METLNVLENLIFIIFEMQFLQLFKRLYPQKAFWRRLISGFYLSCQKIILNSTGNLKLFWLIKIGSKISPWLFLSFLKDDLWSKKRYDAALLWPKIGHCSKRPCYLGNYFRPKWVMISMKDIHLLPPYYLVYTRAKNYVQDNYIFTWRCDPFKLKSTFFRSVVEPVISYFCIF